jgi:hypothetical protein
MVRVLVIEDDGTRSEGIKRLELPQIELEVVREEALKQAIQEWHPQVACAEWYQAPGRLRDSARWLLQWSGHHNRPIHMATISRRLAPLEVGRVITEAVEHYERWGRAPLPEEIIAMIECAEPQEQRMFAVSVAMHAISSVEGYNSDLYFTYMQLRQAAAEGRWPDGKHVLEPAFRKKLDDLVAELNEAIQCLCADQTVYSPAKLYRLHRCCRVVLAEDPAEAARDAAAYALPLFWDVDRFLLTLAHHELRSGRSRGVA